MNESKESSAKLKIFPSSDSHLVRSMIIWIIALFRADATDGVKIYLSYFSKLLTEMVFWKNILKK